MSIVLDGTTGLAGAATGALNGALGATTPSTVVATDLTTTGNTILGNASTDTLNVGNGGLVKDASGNVGIGVTPSAWGSTYKAIQLGSTAANYYFNGINAIANNFYNDGTNNKYIASLYASAYSQDSTSGIHKWFTAPSGTAGATISFTQAMTLDASGYLMLNTTGLSGARGYFEIEGNSATTRNLISTNNLASGTGSNAFVAFSRNGTYTGGISQTGTTSAFVTSSDYRLKENVAPMAGALDKVALLKPVTYTWKLDGSAGQGFIAHELQEVVPDAVTGEKDAVNEDGSIKSQGIDTSFLVATLTAAIQELNAKFEEYKASHP